MDYIDGFAKGAGLNRQKASEQVSAMKGFEVSDWEDYHQGIEDGESFASVWADQEADENPTCEICGREILSGETAQVVENGAGENVLACGDCLDKIRHGEE